MPSAHVTIARCSAAASRRLAATALVCLTLALSACEREPMLHLHQGGQDVDIKLPDVELELNVLWDYLFEYDLEYDWKAEWEYGWDLTDSLLFGPIGNVEPHSFNVRRYYMGSVPYGPHSAPFRHHLDSLTLHAKFDFGYWDVLAWSDIVTPDGVQSVRIDETSTYDYVTACTGQTMIPSRYSAPAYNRAFYQPEEFFAGYAGGIEINRNLDGFEFDEERNIWVRRLVMVLQPVTYIYLPQVILHHNNRQGRIITSIDGMANLSGMARSVTLNTGVTGADAITVHYNMRMKRDLTLRSGEVADIVGGKVNTFGITNLNPHSLNTRAYAESMGKVNEADRDNRHYIDVTMQFANGMDSTFVFDVTDQVRRLFRGGVITMELDMDTVPVPQRSGGSGFDAVVKDYDEEQWEFDM